MVKAPNRQLYLGRITLDLTTICTINTLVGVDLLRYGTENLTSGEG